MMHLGETLIDMISTIGGVKAENGQVAATVLKTQMKGFNQDAFYLVKKGGWRGVETEIDGYQANSGLLKPGDVVHLSVNSYFS